MHTQAILAALLIAAALPATSAQAGEPLVWVEAFTIPPAHSPIFHIMVKNPGEESLVGSMSVELPGRWTAVPAAVEVSLGPGESTRVTFSSEQGADVVANRYPVEVTIVHGGQSTTHRQEVYWAGTPFFSPEIDGRVEEWKDAIPITFKTDGQSTTVATYWNRRRFSVMVAVEQEALRPQDGAEPFDAVQISLAPDGAATGASPDEEAQRFEFLLAAADGAGQGRVYQLAEPGMKLARAAEPRSLEGLEVEDAELVVRHEAGVTYYECAIPLGAMRAAIRPSEGRAYQFSVLVHDPGGTGLRDLGQAVGLWPCRRNPLAWSRFPGDSFGETPPYDSKTPWRFISSRH